MGEESGRDVQENGPCWSDAPGRAPRIVHPPARHEHWASHMVGGAKFPEVPGRGCLRKEVFLYHLKPLAPSLSSQLPDPLPKSRIPDPPAAGQPAPPPHTVEALGRSINVPRRDQEVTTPGWAAGEAGSSLHPGEDSGLPGKIQWTCGQSLGSQTVNSSDAGYTFSSWAWHSRGAQEKSKEYMNTTHRKQAQHLGPRGSCVNEA